MDEVERASLRAPAVIVVGEVVSLRARLNWFEGLSDSVVGNELFNEREAAAVAAL
jgi:hypothetical protein